MGASHYARVVPYIRAVLSQLPRPESLREAAEASTVQEAVSTVSTPLLVHSREARSVSDIGVAAWRDYASIVRKAARLSPAGARLAVEYGVLYEDAKDVLSYIFASLRRSFHRSEIERLPTAGVEGTTVSALLRSGHEAVESVDRIVELAPSPTLRRVYSKVLTNLDLSNPVMILYAMGPLAARLLEEAISGLGRDAGLVASVYCPRVLYTLVSGAIQAKASGVDARSLDRAYGGVELCGFSWDRGVKQIYESEATAQSFAASLSQVIPGYRLEGASLGSLLESLRLQYRARVLEKARAALASYPFQAGFVAGGLEVVRIFMEDLAYILASTQLRVPRERVLARTAPA